MYELYRIVIKPGCTTLEDHIVRPIKEVEKEPCDKKIFVQNLDGAKLLLNIMYVEIKIENVLLKEKVKDQ